LRTSPPGSSSRENPRRVPSARTRFESRLAFGGGNEGNSEENVTPTRKFSVWDTTSGLPDDSREEDERAAERHLRDLRGHVKEARALVSATPGLGEMLHRDWRRAALFYVRFGISEEMFRRGVPAEEERESEEFVDQFRTLCDSREEIRSRKDATVVSDTRRCGGSQGL
jgi:hypothetical protein